MKIVNRIIQFNQSHKLMLSTGNSFKMVEIENINHLRSWGNYTEIHLINNKKIVTTTPITVYEELLANNYFFRVSKSSLVNLNQVESYNHKKRAILLKNTQEIEVARRKQKDFINAIYVRTITLP